MSALNREFDNEKKEVVTENLGVTATKHSTQIKKRNPQEQIAWESDLVALLQKQRQYYESAIRTAFLRTQPPGVLNMEYVGNIPKMRDFLHQKYGVSMSSEGIISFRATGNPDDKVHAVYLGVLELQARSAVPIVQSQGGTVEEHITLLNALLSADCSLPRDRIETIVTGIREYVKDKSPEMQRDLEILIGLSTVNSMLHTMQQGYAKPLSQAERRAALVAWIKQDNPENVDASLKKLESSDAHMKALGSSKPAQRTLGWTQPKHGTSKEPVVSGAEVTVTSGPK